MSMQRHVAELRWRGIRSRQVPFERVKNRKVFRPDGTEVKRPRPERPQRRHTPRMDPWWLFKHS